MGCAHSRRAAVAAEPGSDADHKPASAAGAVRQDVAAAASLAPPQLSPSSGSAEEGVERSVPVVRGAAAKAATPGACDAPVPVMVHADAGATAQSERALTPAQLPLGAGAAPVAGGDGSDRDGAAALNEDVPGPGSVAASPPPCATAAAVVAEPPTLPLLPTPAADVGCAPADEPTPAAPDARQPAGQLPAAAGDRRHPRRCRLRVAQYELGRVLGRGSYGVVHEAVDTTTGGSCAVKVLAKSLLRRRRVGRFGNALQGVQREVAIWKKLDHAHVVALREVLDDPASDAMYLVSELVGGGPLIADPVLKCSAARGATLLQAAAEAGSRGSDSNSGGSSSTSGGSCGDSCGDAAGSSPTPPTPQPAAAAAAAAPAPADTGYRQQPRRRHSRSPPPPPYVSLARARVYMAQLLDGLTYLHFQRVVHRDIKPANLLRARRDRAARSGSPAAGAGDDDDGDGSDSDSDDEGVVLKIADFGVSHMFSADVAAATTPAGATGGSTGGGGDLLRSTAGTAAFSSPEMLTGAPFSGTKADVWAAGVTLFTLLHGRPVFAAPSLHELYAAIADDGAPLPWPALPGGGGGWRRGRRSRRVPAGVRDGGGGGGIAEALARDLVARLLDRNPAIRPSVADAARHPFLTGYAASTALLRPLPLPGAAATAGGACAPPQLIEVDAADIDAAIRPTLPFHVAARIAAMGRRLLTRAAERRRQARSNAPPLEADAAVVTAGYGAGGEVSMTAAGT